MKTLATALIVALCLNSMLHAQTHPAMRPLPVVSKSALTKGPRHFVDATRGDDAKAGTEQEPWKTLGHALRRLKPGDTLYLRGGTYFEKVPLTQSGTPEQPITIASYPGELAVIDGSAREFQETPASSWEPLSSGAEGEFVSTRSFADVDDRRVPHQFLPAAWEPMWGIEEQRPLALGHFADSMVPLHGYRSLKDLRSMNELWVKGKKEDFDFYCGPGVWFDRETGRVHIRLAHHQLDGLGNRAYRGETDPRKLPLIIALGFGDDVLRLTGIKHVRLQNLILRGATGSPMISIYGCENIQIDHCAIFGGNPGLLINASKNITMTHSTMRGLAAPWTGRAHMKYRGTASYQIVLRDDQPINENIEFANCEFTDDHDFAFLRFAKNLKLHHCFIDNFNDDGFEVGPKRRDHTLYIFQNRIGGILSHFTQHEMDKDEAPLDHDPGAGAYIYRNVIDQRAGAYYQSPSEPDPSGDFLHHEGHLVGDHGGPIWAVMRWYHNSILRRTPTFRDYFLLGLGAQGIRSTERDVFNNILVQIDKMPGASFAGLKEPWSLREGGNILWGVNDSSKADPFAKFRASPLFEASKKIHAAGWTTQDRVLDPKFASLTDLRLQGDSPAINTGIALPAEWPDEMRADDKDAPDVGALPIGAKPWGVGVDGRVPLFGESTNKN
ncbi:hypothetical protein [Prosthecobacter sp.]|uniref:hypothetical protein n=1 Tax=Prosthecobacter sp. TaxID=1965333 RepID=UPI002ABB4E13|nr:hypothetical protein [Prosthecobacter sp.]MDZ4406063.1 hypothetical protein [Prosthecobacter sp.]